MGLSDNFYRLKRLPPYVFAQVQSLKLEARHRGEDIIDFGMGNPDQPTPNHIVEKMIEAARKGKNHRYSASRGITKLRHAIAAWYQRNYDVNLDPETEAIVTIGSKEGLAHLSLAMIGDAESRPLNDASCRRRASGTQPVARPTYASITRGSASTACGEPSASVRP